MKPQGYAGAPSSSSAQVENSFREEPNELLERMLERSNLRHAYKRVKQNGGAPGIDGKTVEQLQAHLGEHWETVKRSLQAGTYRVARKVKDKRILKLIRAYLNAGVMESGITQETSEGTPQGGPLSPLLANILLDDP